MKKTLILALLGACNVGFSQTTILHPHFTLQSKEVTVPRGAEVCPEIHEGLIAVRYNGSELVYVNTDGKCVSGPDFSISSLDNQLENDYFSGGAVMVTHRLKSGDKVLCILYPDGTYRDLPDYSSVSAFRDGFALAVRGKSFYKNATQVYINKEGREVFPLLAGSFDPFHSPRAVSPLCENRRAFFSGEQKKYGYADEKGNIVIPPRFEDALPFSDELAAVQVKTDGTKKWGFIDLNGQMVIQPVYVNAPGRFSEGHAAVRIGPTFYQYQMTYIDRTGRQVTPLIDWDCNTFHSGYAWVKKGECGPICVVDSALNEVRNVTGTLMGTAAEGTCPFNLFDAYGHSLAFDFPGGTQSLNTRGVGSGSLYKPDGTIAVKCVDEMGRPIAINNITEGGLLLCVVRFTHESRFNGKERAVACFINLQGEVVLYFI